MIVEGFVDFDYEITLLTVRHCGGTSFLEPIGHYQQDGDYRESWQPQPMNPAVRAQAEEIARRITEALGGWGLFGVELFVRDDRVIFSEVSPAPARYGYGDRRYRRICPSSRSTYAPCWDCRFPTSPFTVLRRRGPSWSKETRTGWNSPTSRTRFREPDTQIRIFGKPEIQAHRRMAVLLARAETVEKAREKTARAYAKLQV